MANWRPMPRLAPVTMTTLSSSSICYPLSIRITHPLRGRVYGWCIRLHKWPATVGSVSVGRAESTAQPELRSDAARNRARVIEVARAQVDAGDLTLPMNTIAKLGGVGVGTVYRHFPTRQALLEAVAADAFDALLVEARLAAAEPSGASALERLLRCALRLVSTDQGFAAVLESPTCACTETLQRGAELGALITSVLDRARRARLIRDDITADDLRCLMSGFGHTVAPIATRRPRSTSTWRC